MPLSRAEEAHAKFSSHNLRCSSCLRDERNGIPMTRRICRVGRQLHATWERAERTEALIAADTLPEIVCGAPIEEKKPATEPEK